MFRDRYLIAVWATAFVLAVVAIGYGVVGAAGVLRHVSATSDALGGVGNFDAP